VVGLLGRASNTRRWLLLVAGLEPAKGWMPLEEVPGRQPAPPSTAAAATACFAATMPSTAAAASFATAGHSAADTAALGRGCEAPWVHPCVAAVSAAAMADDSVACM
jgi:hypothetical protein